jgi:hypothetical protein
MFNTIFNNEAFVLRVLIIVCTFITLWRMVSCQMLAGGGLRLP